MSARDTVLIVPCYNEAGRLDRDAFISFARSGHSIVLFVNDGSTDATAGVLQRLQQTVPDYIQVLALERNRGKAEAVRRGLEHALSGGAKVVGYCDADLATPLAEVARLLQAAETGGPSVVFGSRVAMMGCRIERSAVRHYLGRVFATAASFVLGVPVYDTQCGAKCFRASDALRAAVDQPFLSSWAFDVELLGRLMIGTPDVGALGVDDIVEVPLRHWRDVGNSKLRTTGMIRAVFDLLRIHRDLGRRQGKATIRSTR